ncbi:MAG: hypothetical protein WAM60_18620 [Candidatus Promineifilaceae bacterium]
MLERENQSSKNLFLVRGLTVVAAINCVIVPVLFAQQRPLFPLPGLYLIEIAVLGIFGLTGLLLVESASPFWRAVPWVVAGALLAFVILGGFTIGFFLIPATVAFSLASVLLNRIEKGPLSKYIGLLLIATILQATLIILLAQ